MPKKKGQMVLLSVKDLHPKLCPKCQLLLKKLIGEKVAEQVLKE